MATMTHSANRAARLIQSFLGSVLSPVHAGDDKIASTAIHAAPMANLSVWSRTFHDQGFIPERNSPQGDNTSPDISWSGAPSGTRELVLVVEDPDAPMMNPFVHWIVHRISPETKSIPAGLPGDRALIQLGNAVQGRNDAMTRGYYGPKPPIGHGVHHYHFQLFALDATVGLGPDATVDELKKAMKGHVVGFGEIVGLYERTVDKN
jgi:Raf kinase inhibitor-like YbhB/YbcL family protein